MSFPEVPQALRIRGELEQGIELPPLVGTVEWKEHLREGLLCGRYRTRCFSGVSHLILGPPWASRGLYFQGN